MISETSTRSTSNSAILSVLRVKDASLFDVCVMTYTTRESTPTHTAHTTRNTRVKSKMNFSLCKRALSPARHVMEDTSHQIRHKIDAGDALLLMGSINYTRLAFKRH